MRHCFLAAIWSFLLVATASAQSVDGAARTWATPTFALPFSTSGRPPFYEPKVQTPPIQRSTEQRIRIYAANVSAANATVSLRCFGPDGRVAAELPAQTVVPNGIARFEPSGGGRVLVMWCRLSADQPVIASGLYVWRENEGTTLATETHAQMPMHVLAR